MATGDRRDPYRQFMFRVEIDGITLAEFQEVTADTTTDPVDYREGTEPPTFRKLPGLTKFGKITLKWGITDSMDLYKWRKQVMDTGAGSARRKMSIILIDEAGNDQARWDVVNAWPSKYGPLDFSAKGNEVAIELLEIVHEGFTRVR